MKKSYLILLNLILLLTINGFAQKSNNYFVGAARQYLEEDYKGAIITYSHIIATDPKFILLDEVYHMRGLCKFYSNDYKGAISDYTKALEISPNWKEVHYHRGLAKIRLNQIDSGCQDFRKARDLGYTEASVEIKEYCQ